MQLDFHSVEKVPFSAFAWTFAPKMLEIGLPRLRVNRSFLQDLSRAVSRFSRGPVAGNHRQHFFDPTGSNTITIPGRIENNVFLDPMDNTAVQFQPTLPLNFKSTRAVHSPTASGIRTRQQQAATQQQLRTSHRLIYIHTRYQVPGM